MMSCKADPKDYTPEQKEALANFYKKITAKVGVSNPCLVYDPPPDVCNHSECQEPEKHTSINTGILSKLSKEELDSIIESAKNLLYPDHPTKEESK